MATYKDKKIMQIISQFDATAGQKYEINGIDLELAVFFYREPQGAFNVMTTSDYRVVEEGGNFYLEVNNSAVTSVAESYQITYNVDLLSSKYEIAFNPDINTLKDKYNQLVDDTHTLFDYIRKQALISDDSLMEIILPQLETGEVWVKTADGWRGLNVGDIEQSLEQFWIEFNATTAAMIAALQAQTDASVALVETTGDNQVNRISSEVSYASATLISLERLYSVALTRSKYLDGAVGTLRTPEGLIVTADGGKGSDRATSVLRRTYDGGKGSDRVTPNIDVVIDLGEGA